MTPGHASLPPILQQSAVEVVFGPGRLSELGAHARAHGAARVLLVTDPGIEAAGHVDRAVAALTRERLEVIVFDGVVENPTTVEVAAGVTAAADRRIDFIVAVGGGSSMDCAKGVNLILTNGGQVQDYWGVNRNREPMLPMIAVPTTAGTGSEAQSFALITDPDSHRKMACGVRALPQDGGLRPRVAILDPDLTASQPPEVARAAGIDAVAHAVETAGCSARNAISRAFSSEAWKLLQPSYAASLQDSSDGAVRARMLLGAHLAGAAIEHSMLGAAHAAANPLTARYGTVHGVTVGLMLPHVVAHNTSGGDNPYADLATSADDLVSILEGMLAAAGLPRTLSEIGVPRQALPELAAMALREWTAGFNPRPLDTPAMLEIYRRAC